MFSYYGEPELNKEGDVIATRIGNKEYAADTLNQYQQGFIAGLNEAREILKDKINEWSSIQNDVKATSLDKLRSDFVSEALENIHYLMSRNTAKCIVIFSNDNAEAENNCFG